MAIVHSNTLAVEERGELVFADAIHADLHAQLLVDVVGGEVVEVLLADERVIHLEAATVLEGLAELCDRYMSLLEGKMMMILRGVMMCLLVEMLDDNGFARANFKAVLFDALAEEEFDCLLIAHFDVRLHFDALAAPEIVKVLLAEPFLARLRM